MGKSSKIKSESIEYDTKAAKRIKLLAIIGNKNEMEKLNSIEYDFTLKNLISTIIRTNRTEMMKKKNSHTQQLIRKNYFRIVFFPLAFTAMVIFVLVSVEINNNIRSH